MVAQQSPKLLVRVQILAFLPDGECSSVVERLAVAQVVAGSNPVVHPRCGSSSMVEQGTHNPLVIGSSPVSRTI